jgi:hypothetical protein
MIPTRPDWVTALCGPISCAAAAPANPVYRDSAGVAACGDGSATDGAVGLPGGEHGVEALTHSVRNVADRM